MPSGVHRPESGSTATTFSFYGNWYDPGGDPQSIDVVIDGVCHAMSVEIGTDVGNRTYLYQTVLPAGCREYYVLARDSGGARVTYPEVGSLLIEVGGGACADNYAGTQLAALCESVSDGGAAPDSGPGPDSASTPDQGAAQDSGAGPDSGPTADTGSTPDGGCCTDLSTYLDVYTTPDQGSVDPDGGIAANPDQGDDQPADGAGGEADGGEGEIAADCSCAMGSRSSARGGSVALALFVLLCARSRRARRR